MSKTQYETIAHTLSGAVAAGGTFTISYPEGKTRADYQGGTESYLTSISKNTLYQNKGQISLAFGASNITVTLNSGAAFSAGEKVWLTIDIQSVDIAVADAARMDVMTLVKVNLGAPDAADADGAVASQAATAASGLATGINGALASDGVATFDVPRNVVAAWTGTAVLTVTGTDAKGAVLVESSASGTSLAGKKAFKTVTGISVSANVTGLTVGTGDVLGLPMFLAHTTDVIKELEDDAVPTGGTIVAGDQTTATATTGDINGTYDPNSACDGSAVFELLVAVRDPQAVGVAQFGG